MVYVLLQVVSKHGEITHTSLGYKSPLSGL